MHVNGYWDRNPWSPEITINFQWLSGNLAASFCGSRDSPTTLEEVFKKLVRVLGMPRDQLKMVIDSQAFVFNDACADKRFFSINAVTRCLANVSGQEHLSLSVTLVYMDRHARP